MSTKPLQSSEETERLRKQNAQLQETIQILESERDSLIAQRFRRLLIFGIGISLVIHISIMIWLSMLRSNVIGPGGASEATYEFAILDEEQLSQLEQASFDSVEAQEASMADVPLETELLAPSVPTVEMAVGASGSVPTLGASGTGTGGQIGLGGGGGTASFFGTGGKGQRFAFIVDISGSMGQNQKLDIAMRELARSIDALPDFAYFHIILFESNTTEPPSQNGWMRARKGIVRQVIRWLGTIEPNGGTEPRNAFLQAFALDVRPDVIFFLTDGIFNDISLEELAALNARGKKVIINTIGFGAPGEVDQSILRSIASQSGGQYRFVSTGSAP